MGLVVGAVVKKQVEAPYDEPCPAHTMLPEYLMTVKECDPVDKVCTQTRRWRKYSWSTCLENYN